MTFSNPDFKVTILFNVKQLKNGTRLFTMADQQKVSCRLSNGAIFNDLERPLTWFSRSRHSLTLNISQTATDKVTLTTEGE